MIKKTILTFLLVACVASNAMAQDVKVAIFPSDDPKKLYTVMSVLADYLSSSTGDRVTAVVTRDYMELAQRLKEETVDIAWINTLNYVKIKNEIPSIKYIATYMELNADTGKIMPFYQSYIVTHKQSGITSLEQARGKLFAFTDPGSTSGYAYPNMLLTKQGIIPDQYFGKVFFLKKHDRVIEALLKGAIDVGAVSDGTYFNAARNHGDKFVDPGQVRSHSPGCRCGSWRGVRRICGKVSRSPDFLAKRPCILPKNARSPGLERGWLRGKGRFVLRHCPPSAETIACSMSLRNKLILIILIPIAVLSILHVLGLQRVITGYEASLIANQDSLARSATRAIKNQMERMIRITVTLSRPGEIIHAVEAADNNVLYDWSKSFVGAVDCIQFADIAGIVLSRAPDEFRFGDNVRDSKYFTAALEEDVFFDICVMEGKTALVASRTVRKYDDMPVGVVTVASYMTPNLLRTLIGPEGDVLQYTGEKVVTSSAINSSVQRTVPLSLDELGQGFAGAFTVIFEEEEEYKRLLSLEKFGYASGLSAALAAVLALLLVFAQPAWALHGHRAKRAGLRPGATQPGGAARQPGGGGPQFHAGSCPDHERPRKHGGHPGRLLRQIDATRR